ncbi:MAG: type II toxin-antitoxin system VapC family toxin [Promethearchaeota archaeon]|nr:MAG: type II toxin-antitoxin system VapC family toxin [Candidatus Lokiarchaeota archaeon]
MSIEEILSETSNLVLDTSVLMGYFMDEKLSIIPLLEEYVFNENSSLILYGHNLLKSEIYYIICRKKGTNIAKNVLSKIENVINIISDSWLFEKAGAIKCKYPIAIADCFSISLGQFQDCPIFFLEERELSQDVIKKINEEFKAKIYIVS